MKKVRDELDTAKCCSTISGACRGGGEGGGEVLQRCLRLCGCGGWIGFEDFAQMRKFVLPRANEKGYTSDRARERKREREYEHGQFAELIMQHFID